MNALGLGLSAPFLLALLALSLLGWKKLSKWRRRNRDRRQRYHDWFVLPSKSLRKAQQRRRKAA